MIGSELARRLLTAKWSGTGKDWFVPSLGFMRGWGITVPADESTGYGKGCIFIHTDGATEDTLLYVNTGDKDSAAFKAVSSLASTGTDFSSTGLKFDVIAESTEATGVTIDGLLVKDKGIDASGLATGEFLVKLPDNKAIGMEIKEGDNSYLKFSTTSGSEKLEVGKALETGSVIQSMAGDAAAAAALRLGKTATEGFEIKVIDEEVTLTNEVETNLTQTIPAGAVILSVQGNLNTAVAGDGSGDDLMAKVGIGITADPDKYGKTSDLTKNLKIDTIPDWAVLSAEETVCVKGVKTDGSACTEKFTAGGKVRVRIVYAVSNSLDDAA